MKTGAQFVPARHELAAMLGKPKPLAVDKARKVRDWQPRSAADAVTATAESLLQRDLVRAAHDRA